MTVEPAGHVMWSPNPIRQRLANYLVADPAAGIPHYLRVDQGSLHTFADDLVDGRYEIFADSETELVLSAPFGIELPIREITP